MPQRAPHWRFARMSPSQINQDPVHGEFFTATSDLAERLVRESIQNSLDAGREGTRVRVRFAFSGEGKAIAKNEGKPFLQGIYGHIEAIADMATSAASTAEEKEYQAAYKAWVQLDKPLTYLVVEDFGTTGLQGEVEANSEKEENNDFWGFFRSIGISPKSEDASGSWGLGKWVFPDVSMINAYFGLTRRDGEKQSLLMGTAMLRTHTRDDNKYPPYGFFAAYSDQPDEEWLPCPVKSSRQDDEFIDRFKAYFRLDRGNEPGLSVVIPYPKTDLRSEDLIRAAITQYFLPIIRGDLRVQIEHPSADQVDLDRDSIETLTDYVLESPRDQETASSMRALIHLARWAIEQHEHTEFTYSGTRQKLKEAVEALNFVDLTRRFDAGERLAFRASIKIRQQGQEEQEANYSVYLEQDNDLNQVQAYFVRGDLRIPKMRPRFQYKARALVLVDNKSELGHLLRDAEGPAHASWDPHAQRLKERWSGGYDRVQSVRETARLLLQHLEKRSEEQQFDALADLFPEDSVTARRRGRKSQPEQTPTLPMDTARLAITPSAGGFTVRSAKGSEPRVRSRWVLRCAYDVAHGGGNKALGDFERGNKQGYRDFSLREDHMRIQERGCDVEITGHNELRFTIVKRDFRIRVAGFDSRDVLVLVQEDEPATPSGGAPQP